MSAGIVRFSHGDTPQNYNLTLGYEYLTDAQASEIRAHYEGQYGTYRSFMLPAVIWKGHTFSGSVFPVTTRWRYAEPPEETHHELGRCSMDILLTADGTYEFADWGNVVVTFSAGGALAVIDGFDIAVTGSIVPGTATGA